MPGAAHTSPVGGARRPRRRAVNGGRRPSWLGVLVAVFALVLFPSTAFADPAGPTDYLSEVRSIEPATPAIEVNVLGGDSFLQLKVEDGTDVIVVGYQSEDYLWFRADGTVLENRNAPSTYTNDDRFGGAVPPPNATVDAEPDWQEVATGGRYSWHDHRAHWMQSIRPAGKQVGDQIVEGVIPLVVDGSEVDVTVISTWQPEPSPASAIGGAAGGIALVGAAVWAWRSNRHWVVAAVPIAALALVAGVLQYVSLPSETGPRFVWWVLPAIAVVASVAGVVAERRGSAFTAKAAALVVGVQLVVWGVIKRDGLTAALVPSDAPGWLDRLATASAITGGALLTALALFTLFGPLRPGQNSDSGSSTSRPVTT